MRKNSLFIAALLAACGLATVIGSYSLADTSTNVAPAAQGEMQLPPGWTAEDMQAMMAAGTPGKMHERLAQDIGTWRCKTTMWMAPDTEPMTSEGTSTVTPLLGGRFTECEMKGEMPGMGPYDGLGIYGFDNVSQQFVCTWIDNHGTGMMNGVGELSADGKTINWEFTGNCPVTRKPITMREVETTTGPNTKTLEMFGTPPKGGEEFKMMSIEMTKE